MPSRAASGAMVERLRFRRAPLAAAAVAFAVGIAVGHSGFNAGAGLRPVALVLAALGLLVALTGLAVWRAPRVAVWPALGVWVALGIGAVGWQPAPAGASGLQGFADGLSRTVRGRVVRVHLLLPAAERDAGDAGDEAAKDADAPPAWEATEDTTGQMGRPAALDLQVDAIEAVTADASTMVSAAGGVRVSVFAPGAVVAALGCGDVVEMPLRLRLPDRYRDPGVFQEADLLASQGIAAHASVAGAAVRRVGAMQSPSRLACRLAAAQTWAAGRLAAFVRSRENRRLPAALRLNEADAGMLDAMLFGDRSGLTRRLRVGFERTGSFHLFVVSGVHIALLAGGLFALLRRLRVRPWLATLATLAGTAAYAAVTGFGQPAQRALAMTAVFLVARLLAREHETVNALGAAMLTMLAWSPRSLFEASFQMTVLAIVAIGGLALPLAEWTFLVYAQGLGAQRRTHSRSRFTRQEEQLHIMLAVWDEALVEVLGEWVRSMPRRLVRWVLWGMELALIGVVAELVMVLPMALYFHRAAVLAVPANLVVLPCIGVLLPAAVITFVASLLSPWLALLPGAATALLLHLLAGGIARISHFAVADVRVPAPVGWVGLLAVAGWLGCCWLVRRSRAGAWATALALPAIAAMVLWPEPMVRVPDRLEVTAIDVGQGDSLLVVGPDGRTMLVDAGGPVGRGGNAEPVAAFDVGEQVVAPVLWTRRVRRLDVLVLTHAHTDHMGGMPAVLADFRPRELWVSIDPHSPLYAALLAEAAAYGVTVRHLHTGEVTAFGVVGVRVLSPMPGYGNPGRPKNDDSLVLELTYGKASVLLEGDAERPSEEAMLAAGLVHPVTLLKVGHHGSKTSSLQEFVDAARPREAVISVGRHNTFGHPRGEVIERFAAAGTRLYRTDLFGLSTFLLGADGGIDEVPYGGP